MPKWLDLPPIWLIAMMALMYLAADLAPFPDHHGYWTGGVIIVLGVKVAIWAAISFRRQRTTIIPHQTPTALITGGPFQHSRNPIYLADLLVLIGWGCILGAALPFLAAPLFIWIINARFIKPEETRLAQAFGAPYAEYCAKVRRWI